MFGITFPFIVLGECRYFVDEFQNKRKGTEDRSVSECKAILEKHLTDSPLVDPVAVSKNLTKLDEQVLALTKVQNLLDVITRHVVSLEIFTSNKSAKQTYLRDSCTREFLISVVEPLFPI